MRFSATVAATAALVAGVSAGSYGYGNSTVSPVAYVTETYVDYTTYCPEATKLTIGESTYTVTEATTLTITACSCTLTKPVYTSLVTSCSTAAPVASSVAPVASTGAPVHYSSASPIYPIGTGAKTTYSVKATGTGAYTAPISTFTGAADKVGAASGAGLAAIFGLVAYVL